jgi:hypothetical protein
MASFNFPVVLKDDYLDEVISDVDVAVEIEDDLCFSDISLNGKSLYGRTLGVWATELLKEAQDQIETALNDGRSKFFNEVADYFAEERAYALFDHADSRADFEYDRMREGA